MSKIRADKIVSLSEAAAYVEDGDHIALSGFGMDRNPISFVFELIRQERKNLIISQSLISFDADLLVGAGCVRKIIYGGVTFGRLTRAPRVVEAIERGNLELEEYSILSMSFKYLAGALGIPFIPINSLIGTDLIKNLKEKVIEFNCPFTQKPTVLITPLNPDIAIVHVQISDEQGNAIIYGPLWDNVEMVKSSKKVILISDKIVSQPMMLQEAERITIPGHRVEAVVPLTFGAYFTGSYRHYDFDAEHCLFYLEHAKDSKKFNAYVDKYVLGVQDHFEFLEKVGGMRKVEKLTADFFTGY